LIKPYGSDGDSFYTNDIDSVQTRRAQMAYFFTKVIGNLEENEINTEKFFNQLNRWGTSFLEVTGSKIGSNLPFYDVSMD